MNPVVEEPVTPNDSDLFSSTDLTPLIERAATAIKARPLVALATALALGYVLGRLVRR